MALNCQSARKWKADVAWGQGRWLRAWGQGLGRPGNRRALSQGGGRSRVRRSSAGGCRRVVHFGRRDGRRHLPTWAAKGHPGSVLATVQGEVGGWRE